MRTFLESNTEGNRFRRVEDMDSSIPYAAWMILRWCASRSIYLIIPIMFMLTKTLFRCIHSNLSYIKEITRPEDRIPLLAPRWRQFEFVGGSPDAEAKFAKWKEQAGEENAKARKWPTLWAFGGRPTQNWHSVGWIDGLSTKRRSVLT